MGCHFQGEVTEDCDARLVSTLSLQVISLTLLLTLMKLADML
jgi:hypothetical protein